MRNKLLIGNPNSTFIQEMLFELKKNNSKLNIDLICSKQNLYGELHANNIYDFIINSRFSVLKLVVFYIKVMSWCLKAKREPKYDGIDIHFVNIYYLPILPFLKLRTKNLNLVFWGSDLLRCKHEILLSKIIQWSDTINISTVSMKEHLENKYAKCILNKNIEINLFGSQIFKVIDNLDESNVDSSNCYYFDELNQYKSKIAITVGYNGAKEQQHIKIVNAIKGIDNIDNYIFIFPMTYGLVSFDYLDEIKELCAEYNLNTIFLTSYMTSFEVAYLRSYSDIFIQLQITDAFSGSMQEHIYGGARVITGSWLNYEELVSNKVSFSQISNFEELCNLNEFPLLTLDEQHHNKKKISELSSWDNVIEGWECLGECN